MCLSRGYSGPLNQRGNFGARSAGERAESRGLGDGAPDEGGGHGEGDGAENEDLFHFAF